MIKNTSRIGNFTSSAISALMTNGREKGSFGKPALTYIEEKNMERRLGRSIESETNAKPLTWGKLLEMYVFEQLGLEYVLTSQETDIHPNIPYWSGSKDGTKFDEGRTVIDIKAPSTLKSFCQLVDPLYQGLTGLLAMEKIRETHKSGDDYYWQLVSNSIINDCKYAELIVFMPYQSQLEEIKLRASNVPADQMGKHYWISMAMDNELPYLIDGGYYKNINIIRFEVPQSDKDALTERVLKAGQMLIGVEQQLPSLKKASPVPTETALPKLQKANQ